MIPVNMESLPVLDYSKKDRVALSGEITQVMENLGFLYLDNIPGFEEEDLRWCVNFFFGLSKEKRKEVSKRAYCPKNSNVGWHATLYDLLYAQYPDLNSQWVNSNKGKSPDTNEI